MSDFLERAQGRSVDIVVEETLALDALDNPEPAFFVRVEQRSGLYHEVDGYSAVDSLRRFSRADLAAALAWEAACRLAADFGERQYIVSLYDSPRSGLTRDLSLPQAEERARQHL